MFRYDRMNELAKQKGVKKAHLCRLLGRSLYYLRDAEKAGTDINGIECSVIAEALWTTTAYLRGETDDPELPKSQDYDLASYIADLRDRPETRALMEASRKLTREEVEAMTEFALRLRGESK